MGLRKITRQVLSFGFKGIVAALLSELVFLGLSVAAALVVFAIDGWKTALLSFGVVFLLLNVTALEALVSSILHHLGKNDERTKARQRPK